MGHCLALQDVRAPADGTACLAYVQGFIAGTTIRQDQLAGATTTDTEGESFSQRAIRQRAGGYVRRVEGMLANDYCIGDDVPASAVLEAIIERLEATPEDSKLTASDIVHEALVQRFPCGK